MAVQFHSRLPHRRTVLPYCSLIVHAHLSGIHTQDRKKKIKHCNGITYYNIQFYQVFLNLSVLIWFYQNSQDYTLESLVLFTKIWG